MSKKAALDWRIGYMQKKEDNIEKKVTIKFTGEELERLEKKYECNREVLNLAIDYALAVLEEHIEFDLHDDVEDAARDCKESVKVG